MLFVGMAILIVVCISGSMIEKRIKNMEQQNDTIIELLKEQLNNKK
ncbi:MULTISPECIES: hypothetical protein [Bacillus]|nr:MULTISPECIES: hypothetical protein [Bacillus]MCA0118266.1 hypothetical protein [Bacillus sp. RSS_NA_20]MDH3107808.1 hypothetical protein [Bacillus altitudinis]MED1425068.1 hypothetical protein [Bacillus altitudinis]MEE3607053.1 hypothetical protein [Bacillus altitudinis]MEE3613136.1 hypothetical protein [Bacillus altitudinis]